MKKTKISDWEEESSEEEEFMIELIKCDTDDAKSKTPVVLEECEGSESEDLEENNFVPRMHRQVYMEDQCGKKASNGAKFRRYRDYLGGDDDSKDLHDVVERSDEESSVSESEDAKSEDAPAESQEESKHVSVSEGGGKEGEQVSGSHSRLDSSVNSSRGLLGVNNISGIPDDVSRDS